MRFFFEGNSEFKISKTEAEIKRVKYQLQLEERASLISAYETKRKKKKKQKEAFIIKERA